MTTGTKYFEWSDAWVMASLFGYNDIFQKIEISKIIAVGDMLNHAILLPNELRQGFSKLESCEIIEIKESKLRLTKIGIELRDKTKGGLFSIVDNTLKNLNLLKLQTSDQIGIKYFDSLSDVEIEKEMNKYKTIVSKK